MTVVDKSIEFPEDVLASAIDSVGDSQWVIVLCGGPQGVRIKRSSHMSMAETSMQLLSCCIGLIAGGERSC